jgi:preprotein translocase subunit YajC
MQFLPIIAMFALAYVILIRPQQRRVKQQRQLVSAIEVGDDVVTVGGLIGRVVRLDDDTVEVESTPGVVLRFRRVAISGRVGPPRADIELDDGHSNGDGTGDRGSGAP